MALLDPLLRALGAMPRLDTSQPAADRGFQLPISGTPELEAGAMQRRMSNWRPASSHVNTLVAGAGSTVRARARWLTRNNPYAINAVDWWGSTVVGAGIVPSWSIEDLKLKKSLRQLWDDWTDEADSEGLTDFYGMQRRAARECFIAGEVFIRIRYRRPEDGFAVPMQLQMLPSEMLDASDTRRLPGGNEIRQGVEFDAIGRRVAYHFWRAHPGDSTDAAGLIAQKTRVPAEDVIHLMDAIEAGQIRGLSRFSNVTAKLFTLDQYDDAELERKHIAAMFAGFITKKAVEDPDPISDPRLDPRGELVGQGAAASPLADEGVVELSAGSMQVLADGEDIKFSEPADVGGSYEAFQYRNLLSTSAGLGVPYSAMTGDVSKANYASSRAQQVDTKKRIEAYQWSVLVFTMCRPVIRAFVTQAALAEVLPGLDTETFTRDRRRYLRIRWMTPAWTWVDPLKDMQADKMAVDNGFRARSDVIEAGGYDAADTDRRIAEDRKREQSLGLAFPQPKDGGTAAATTTPPAEDQPPAEDEPPPPPGQE